MDRWSMWMDGRIGALPSKIPLPYSPPSNSVDGMSITRTIADHRRASRGDRIPQASQPSASPASPPIRSRHIGLSLLGDMGCCKSKEEREIECMFGDIEKEMKQMAKGIEKQEAANKKQELVSKLQCRCARPPASHAMNRAVSCVRRCSARSRSRRHPPCGV